MSNKQSRRNFLKSTGAFATVSSLGAFPNLSHANLDAHDWPEVCARLSGDYVSKINENLENLAIYNNKFSINTELNEKQRYSFREPEFIHPLIVREMFGWISDTGNIIVGINLNEANDSNQFSGDFEVHTNHNNVFVVWREEEHRQSGFNRQSFSYHHIATTPSGVEIVFVRDNTGGTLTLNEIMLFSFEYDKALYGDRTIERTVLKLGGLIGTGQIDNLDVITYENGLLKIGNHKVPVL